MAKLMTGDAAGARRVYEVTTKALHNRRSSLQALLLDARLRAVEAAGP